MVLSVKNATLWASCIVALCASFCISQYGPLNDQMLIMTFVSGIFCVGIYSWMSTKVMNHLRSTDLDFYAGNVRLNVIVSIVLYISFFGGNILKNTFV